MPATAPTLQAGSGLSITDLSGFQHTLGQMEVRLEAPAAYSPPGSLSASTEALLQPLTRIDGEAGRLAADAQAARAEGAELRPGDMVMLTVRCQEFMFHCQLTSNIANRCSDGLQQLFRQQS